MRVLVTGGSGFIGTHLVQNLLEQGHTLLNIDIAPPNLIDHNFCWLDCDILDFETLRNSFTSFSPEWVIHLAARTDVNGKTINDYQVNTVGTKNVLKAIQLTPTIKRLIITSSQFVHRPGHLPINDDDYEPHTIYGESKVITEKSTKEATLNCIWTIIRPTNIWGAWHPRYPKEFWSVLSKNLYFHPVTTPPVVRCYGYVGTIVWQIIKILTLPEVKVHRKTFYLSDPPVELLTWVDAFSLELTGKKARRVPALLVKSLGWIGDILHKLKIRFPITTSRFISMTQNYLVPLNDTFDILGKSPCSLDLGVKETVRWLVSNKGFRKFETK